MVPEGNPECDLRALRRGTPILHLGKTHFFEFSHGSGTHPPAQRDALNTV